MGAEILTCFRKFHSEFFHWYTMVRFKYIRNIWHQTGGNNETWYIANHAHSVLITVEDKYRQNKRCDGVLVDRRGSYMFVHGKFRSLNLWVFLIKFCLFLSKGLVWGGYICSDMDMWWPEVDILSVFFLYWTSLY